MAPASRGAAQSIAASLYPLPRAAARSTRENESARPTIRAASAAATRKDALQLPSLAADDAAATQGGAAALGSYAAASAGAVIGERNILELVIAPRTLLV